MRSFAHSRQGRRLLPLGSNACRERSPACSRCGKSCQWRRSPLLLLHALALGLSRGGATGWGRSSRREEQAHQESTPPLWACQEGVLGGATSIESLIRTVREGQMQCHRKTVRHDSASAWEGNYYNLGLRACSKGPRNEEWEGGLRTLSNLRALFGPLLPAAVQFFFLCALQNRVRVQVGAYWNCSKKVRNSKLLPVVAWTPVGIPLAIQKATFKTSLKY